MSKKRKQEWVPESMIGVLEEELVEMEQEADRIGMPTRVEAWERIADKMLNSFMPLKRRRR